jgi:hypothetical protein
MLCCVASAGQAAGGGVQLPPGQGRGTAGVAQGEESSRNMLAQSNITELNSVCVVCHHGMKVKLF